MEELGTGSAVAVTIDDDRDFNALLKKTLSSLGIETVSATSKEQYFKLLSEVTPDICLVDMNIGDSVGEGLVIIEKTRSLLGVSVPILVISMSSAPQATAHAFEIGANDYIVKPITRQFLASKLSGYLPGKNLSSAQLPIFLVPKTEEEVMISAEFSILGVDELGVTILSEHLISKGANVWVSDPFITEITGGESRVRLTAQASSAKPDSTYLTRLEFDLEQTSLLAAVRRWLSVRNPSERD